MTPALDPELALRYLAVLTPGLRDAVVAGGDGAPLAGDAALAAPALAVLDGAPDGVVREAAHGGGRLVAMRAGGRVVAVDAPAGTLAAVLAADLRTVLGVE